MNVPFYGCYLVVSCFVAHLPGDRPREGYTKATVCSEFGDDYYSDDLCLCFWHADESVERLCGSLLETVGDCLLDDGNTTVPPEPSLQVPLANEEDSTPLPPPLQEANSTHSVILAAVQVPDPTTTVVAADIFEPDTTTTTATTTTTTTTTTKTVVVVVVAAKDPDTTVPHRNFLRSRAAAAAAVVSEVSSLRV